MTSFAFTRRQWLARAGVLAVPTLVGAPASAADAAAVGAPAAAPGADDARQRPLAAKSVCLDITAAGTRLVAVGERGHVLLSDDGGQQWRQARRVPTRTTLTAVHATDDRHLWAVGHGAVILRSDDAGETWAQLAGQLGGKEVLLSIRVEPDGHGLAVGGFGHALRTTDGGATWKRVELLAGEAGEAHLNRIFTAGPKLNTWLIAAEGGRILRSEDRSELWTAVKTPYAGSIWSGAALPGGVLLACGMRGNVLRSTDDGRSWTHQAVAGAGSLTAIVSLPDGRPVVVGVDGTVLTGTVGAESFVFKRQDDRTTFTGAVALPNGVVVVSTPAGMRLLGAAA